MKTETVKFKDLNNKVRVKGGQYAALITSLREGEATKLTMEDGENIASLQNYLPVVAKRFGINIGTARKDGCLYIFLK